MLFRKNNIINTMKGEVWILDDEKGILEILEDILKDEKFQVRSFLWGKELLKEINIKQPKVILLDLWLKDIDGFDVLEKVKKFYPEVQIIIISGHGNIETAVKAIKMGAFDFIEKPLSYERVVVTVENAFKLALLEEENRRLRENIFGGVKLSGVSQAIQKIKELIVKVAPMDTTVLIQGESGVGKEVVAKLIHLYSKRAKEAFVEINCAAIPETLIESELFGYEKGAFSGAIKSKPGKIELAKDGTLFLDEIAEMSQTVQAKFLRVLQDKTFERLGGLTTIKTNARFVVATNKDLLKLVRQGKFREDLYFRVNVFPIYIPPLRERKEAILKIADYIINKLSKKIGKDPLKLSKNSKEILKNYSWPGNIRELENVLERGFILAKGEELELEPEFFEKDKVFQEKKEPENLKELEKRAILEVLKKTGGNKKRAAELLGISLRTLYYKIKEYNLKTP